MTVDDLLRRLSGAFTAFNPKALEAWAPVFRARFGNREGPHLAQAYTNCLASFDPKKTAKLFPTPPDIEAHMPSLKKSDDGKGGKPIRQWLEDRGTRSRKLLTEWMEGQGAKIRDTRAKPLYAACLLEAMNQAKSKGGDERATPIMLKQDKLNECFQRAISKERGRVHGRPEKFAPDVWWSQLVEVAKGWGLEITPDWWSEEAGKTLRTAAPDDSNARASPRATPNHSRTAMETQTT